ncbi:MAG: DUF1175 family protein [Myxococcales bacterium]
MSDHYGLRAPGFGLRAFAMLLLGWAALSCDAPSALPTPTVGAADLDQDGYPDAAELASEDDRRAFVDSFVAIALAQAPEPEAAFDPSQRDCAGLVRYAWRESLKKHDAAFAARHPGLPRLPEIRAFHYPAVPVLGTRLFRVGAGPLDPAPGALERDFAESAQAVRLAEGSARRLEGPARRGDLLLFARPDGAHHLMIVAEDGADPLLVYHTGPHDDGPGEVRRVRFAALSAHPDPLWRPSPANPAFLGAWRLRILEGP